MPTLPVVEAKWLARLEEWRALGVRVDGAKLAEEVLADLHAIDGAAVIEPLTLREASHVSGYSVDHLQRLVSGGQLVNIGRKGRPRVRRSDLPVKRGHALRIAGEASSFAARRRIVASATTGGVS